MLRPSTEHMKPNRFKVNVQGQDTEWYLKIYPNGDFTEAVNHVTIYLYLSKGNVPIKVKYALHVESKNLEEKGSQIELDLR